VSVPADLPRFRWLVDARRGGYHLRPMIVTPSHGSSVVRRLSKARDLLCQELDEKLTLDQAARAAALAPSHFIRAFKAVFGQTPHQVRIDARLDLAKQLLITDSMPVTEVCAAVGFASLGTFSHVFTQRIGSSPSAFRREARVLVQVPGTLPPRLYPGCFTLMGYLPRNAFFEKRAMAGSVTLPVHP
jgi:AraC-like DNA-binding protein